MKSKQEIEGLAEQIYTNVRGSSRLMVIGFIDGYQTAEKELPTWDDVMKAIELARKEVKVPYEVMDGHTIIDYCQYSEEEIIEQLKSQKTKP